MKSHDITGRCERLVIAMEVFFFWIAFLKSAVTAVDVVAHRCEVEKTALRW